MSAQSEDGLTAIGPSIERTVQESLHLLRRRNSLTSVLLHMPTELILKIFEHGIKLDDEVVNVFGDDSDDDDNDDGDENDSPLSWKHCPTLLVLTAVCHKLREIGINTPHLWDTIDFTVPSLARLFLERCNNDPHTIIINSLPFFGGEAVCPQLKGPTFSNLRSVIFRGGSYEFKQRVAPVLQRATNLSNLDVQIEDNTELRPAWYPSTPIPNLSVLSLLGFSSNWTSPLLRNLSQLTLGLTFARPPFEQAPVETFLTALANCPDLESLELFHTGPDPQSRPQGKGHTVVQLRRLQRLSLKIDDAPTVGCILSHISYPKSASVEASVYVGSDTGIPGTISQIFPHADAAILRHLQITEALTIHWDRHKYTVSADNLTINYRHHILPSPQALYWAASKTLEFIGKNAIAFFFLTRLDTVPTNEMWEDILHGFPRLERISYRHYQYYEAARGLQSGAIDPFVLVFSQPSERGLVCPQLQHLELPMGMLGSGSSVALLKRTLTERSARGKRLKRIGLSDGRTTGVDDQLVLKPLRDLADEVG